jgi:flagellar biosynthesis protein FliR
MNWFAEVRSILRQAGVQADLDTFLSIYLLATARIGAALPFIPFLGGEMVPATVRVALAMLVGIVFYPYLAPGFGGAPLTFDRFFPYLIKELLIGALFGLMVQIVFAAVEAAGSLIESAAGLRPDEILAPQVPSAGGPVSRLMGQTAIVLYVTAGLHLLFIQTLADSYATLPLHEFPRFRPGFLPLAQAAGHITSQFLVLALRFSAPIMLLVLLIKIGAGFIFRMSFAGVREDPFQPLAGLAVLGGLFLAAGLYSVEIVKAGADLLLQFGRFLGGFR